LIKRALLSLRVCPFVKQMGQLFGTDDSETMRRLSEITVDEAFLNVAKGQGAITDYERNMLKAPVPKDWAKTEVWQKFMKVRVDALMKLEAFADHEVALSQPEKKGLATMQGIVAERQAARTSQPIPGKAGQMVAQQNFPKVTPEAQKSADDQRATILKQELEDEGKKPDSDRKTKNIAALQRELTGLGVKVAAPVAATAAVAPAAVPADTPGTVTVANGTELKAAIAAGKLKSGDTFIGPDGKKRKVN
jgi:hypothetical protein